VAVSLCYTAFRMMTRQYAFLTVRPTTESLCAAMHTSDRRVAISTVNFGWKFTLGSGVT